MHQARCRIETGISHRFNHGHPNAALDDKCHLRRQSPPPVGRAVGRHYAELNCLSTLVVRSRRVNTFLVWFGVGLRSTWLSFLINDCNVSLTIDQQVGCCASSKLILVHDSLPPQWCHCGLHNIGPSSIDSSIQCLAGWLIHSGGSGHAPSDSNVPLESFNYDHWWSMALTRDSTRLSK